MEEILFMLSNRSGGKVTLSSLGANIVSVVVPDRDGTLAEVVCALPHGVSNWIGKKIGDDTVEFTINPHACKNVVRSDKQVKVTYILREDNTLELYILLPPGAEIPRNFPPVLNVNLNRKDADEEVPQHLYINGSKRESDAEGTADCWQINDWQPDVMNEAIVLASAETGRQLNIYTTMPLIKVSDNVVQPVGNIKGPIAVQCVPSVCQTAASTQLIFYEFKTFQD